MNREELICACDFGDPNNDFSTIQVWSGLPRGGKSFQLEMFKLMSLGIPIELLVENTYNYTLEFSENGTLRQQALKLIAENNLTFNSDCSSKSVIVTIDCETSNLYRGFANYQEKKTYVPMLPQKLKVKERFRLMRLNKLVINK